MRQSDSTFVAAPVDDIQLERSARSWVTALNGAMADRDFLYRLTEDQGTDLASSVFYHSIRAIPRHREFINAVDTQRIPEKPFTSNIKLFVIPAFLYREYPTLGGDGDHILRVARELGMEAELVPTTSTGTVSENTDILNRTLNQCENEEIWLLSMSKGGAEVRLLYQDHAGHFPAERITHWFNVSGLANGSQLVDEVLSSRLRRARTRALCLATGAQFRALEELRTDNPSWQKPFLAPETATVINIFGVPLSSHIERALVARYKRIRHLGPNDGMVLLTDASIEPGLIYPLWGADHYMRDARIIPVLYRLLSHFLTRASDGTPIHKKEQPRKGDRQCISSS